MWPKISAYFGIGFYRRKLLTAFVSLFLYFPFYISGAALLPPCPFAGLDTEFTCSSENTIDLEIDFNIPASLDEENKFHIVFNTDTVGTHAYSEVPLTVYGLPIVQGEGATLFLLVEGDSECDISIGLLESEINCQCGISNIDAEILFCETDSTAKYRINSFDYFDVANSGYTVQINDQFYLSYEYGDFPLELTGPLNDNGDNVLSVIDVGTDDCEASTLIESFECEFCSISNLQVAENDCVDGLFSLELEFDFENVSQEGFSISVNSVDQAEVFEYDDFPITFGAWNGASGQLHVLVFDALNPAGCQASTTIEVEPCATCSLSNLAVQQSPCELGSYSLNVNFDFENVGDNGFEVFLEGSSQGTFDYSDLPIDIGDYNFEGVGSIEIVDLELGDIDSAECILTDFFVATACAAPICEISSITLIDQDCVADYREYELDLEFNESVSDSFDVFVHGLLTPFDRFAYSELPVTVNDQGIFITSADDYELAVADKENSGCSASTSIDPIFCASDCVIGNIDISALDDCEADGTFSILLESEFAFDELGSFFFTVNGGESTVYSYGQLPLTIDGFIGNGETAFLVELEELENDCNNPQVLNPVLCPAYECSFTSFTLSASPCTSEDGSFVLIAAAEVANPGSGGFNLSLNGSDIGDFQYSDLPLNLGTFLGDGQTDFSATITDIENIDCQAQTFLDAVTCAGAVCSISNFSVLLSEECDDNGFYEVTINFLPDGASDEFEVYVNDGFLGQFPYDVLPLILPQGIAGNDTDPTTIEIVDSADSNCSETEEVFAPVCQTPQCVLSNLEVTVLGCQSDDTFDIEVFFEAENGSPAGFKIFLNGTPYDQPFNYDDLIGGPVTINVDGSTGIQYGLSVSDTDDPLCSITWPTLIEQDCSQECFLPPTLTVTPGNCNADNEIQLSLSFDDNVIIPAANDSFDLFIGALFDDTYSYEDLEAGLILGSFLGDGISIYQFEIFDTQIENCSSVGSIAIADCSQNAPCEMGNENFSTTCNGNEFNIEITVDISNQSEEGVQVEVDGVSQGLFDAAMPMFLGPFSADGVTEYEINIFDVEFPDCSIPPFNVGPIDCSLVGCDFSDPLVTANCQPNGLFTAEIEFTIQNAPSDSVVITAGTNNPITFAYADPQPYIIEFLPGDGADWGFTIADSEDPDCNDFFDLGPVDCQICSIVPLAIQPICESDGSLTVLLDFEYENVGDSGFSIQIGNQPFASPATDTTGDPSVFSYEDDLPIEITGLSGSADASYSFTITDNEFLTDCTAFTEFTLKEECPTLPDCFVDITEIVVSECINDSVYLTIDYVYASVLAADSFTVTENDIFIDNFLYGDSLVLGPYLGDGSTYDIALIDLLFGENCQNSELTESLFCEGLIPDNFTAGVPYPNPTESQFVLTDVGIPEAGVLTIEIFNTSGQKLGTSLTNLEPGAHTVQVDLKGYIAGLYLVRASFLGSDISKAKTNKTFVNKILIAKSDFN